MMLRIALVFGVWQWNVAVRRKRAAGTPSWWLWLAAWIPLRLVFVVMWRYVLWTTGESA